MRKILATIMALLLASMPIALADDVSVTVGVTGFLTATFQYTAVAYGTLTQGTSDNVPTPSHLTGVYNVTISTNDKWKVSASGVDFDDGGGYDFGIGNLTMDTNAVAGSLSVGSGTALSTSPQDIDTTMPETDTVNFHGFWLDIPANQYASSYNTNVTVTYASD